MLQIVHLFQNLLHSIRGYLVPLASQGADSHPIECTQGPDIFLAKHCDPLIHFDISSGRRRQYIPDLYGELCMQGL